MGSDLGNRHLDISLNNMANNQIISTIKVDSAADDNKIPVYDAATDTFLMEAPASGSLDVWVRAHKNGTNQTISTGTVTVVTWGTEAEDTNGDFASDTLTIASGEKWELDVHLQIDNMQGGAPETMIYKDGSLYRTIYRGGQWGAGNQSVGGHILLVEAGDYDVRCLQGYGIDRTLIGATTASYLTARRIK